MKQFYKSILLGLFALNSNAFAAEPADGWYAGLMGGLSLTPNLSYNFHSPFFGPVRTRLSYNTIGGGGGGQIGYRWCKFRFEGQLYANVNSFSKLTINGLTFKRHETPLTPFTSISGNTVLGAGLFNAFYEFYDEDAEPNLIPYVGLGIGYGRVQNKLDFRNRFVYLNTVYNLDFDFKDSKSAPVGQIIVGASYFFSDYSALGFDYRYVTTNNVRYGLFEKRLQINSLNLSFNYTFSDA